MKRGTVVLLSVLWLGAGFAAGALGEPYDRWMMVAGAVAMVISFAYQAIRSPTHDATPWRLLLAWSVILAASCLASLTYPSVNDVADVAYVIASIPVFLALSRSFRKLYRGTGFAKALLDGWLYAGSALAIALLVFVIPTQDATASVAAAQDGLLILLDLLVVAMFAGFSIAAHGGARVRAQFTALVFALLAFAHAMNLAGELGRLDSGITGNAIAGAAFGLMSLLPFVGSDATRLRLRSPGLIEAFAPYVVALIVLLSIGLAWQYGLTIGVGVWALTISVFGAFLARQFLTVRDNLRLLTELSEREDHFRSLVLRSTDVILVLDHRGCVQYVSPAVERVLGFTPEQLAGQEFETLLHPGDVEAVADAAIEALGDDFTHTRIPIRLATIDRVWRDTEASFSYRSQDLVINIRDVTEQRAMSVELERLAYHDPLTGLPNRARFVAEVEKSLLRRTRHREWVAVVFLDLDGFKNLNDAEGHDAGDLLLVDVAERLHRVVQLGDIVSRWGGDEFVILLERRPDVAQLHATAAHILAGLSVIHSIENNEYQIGASIGVAIAGPDGEDAATLLRNADLAMYRAKQLGKGRIEHYRPQLLETAISRVAVESRLAKALEERSLGLRYQPIVDLETNRAVAVEALVRWTDADGRPGQADELIAVAEESGRIEDLGRFVLGRALSQAAVWRAAGRPVDVAVNLSARQITAPRLIPVLVEALSHSKLPPSSVILEVTETVLIEGASNAIEQLLAIRGLGVRLMLDDFGTGYSSLAYLADLPVDGLKLDRRFVQRLDSGRGGGALVNGVLRLAQDLGLSVTAEGVETAGQATVLRSLGCQRAQGFLYSPPVPPEKLFAMLNPDYDWSGLRSGVSNGENARSLA